MNTRYYIDHLGNAYVTDGVDTIQLPVSCIDIGSDVDELGCWTLKLEIKQVSPKFPCEDIEQ